MVPRIGAIEPFQIGPVLFDALRVLQGECEFVAMHGEHPADAVRRGLQFCREVGRVGHQSDVIDLILLGHDGQTVVEQHVTPVDGLEVSLAALAVVAEHLQHVFSQVPLPGHALQFLHRLWITYKVVIRIPSHCHPAP